MVDSNGLKTHRHHRRPSWIRPHPLGSSASVCETNPPGSPPGRGACDALGDGFLEAPCWEASLDVAHV